MIGSHLVYSLANRFESVLSQHEDSGQAALCKDDAHGHLEVDGDEALPVCRDLRQQHEQTFGWFRDPL